MQRQTPVLFSIFWTNYQLCVCWNDYFNLEVKKVRNLFLIQFFTFLIIGIGTGVLIYPILDELAINTIPLEKIQTLLQKFKLLDTIRAVIAFCSLILLTISMIEYIRVSIQKNRRAKNQKEIELKMRFSIVFNILNK